MLKTLNTADLTPKEEVTARIDKLRKGMVEKGIELAVILQNVDIFYFTERLQRGSSWCRAEQGPDFRRKEHLSRRMRHPLDVIPIKRDKEVKDILAEKKMLTEMRHGARRRPVAICER
jgi:hypothetical protein